MPLISPINDPIPSDRTYSTNWVGDPPPEAPETIDAEARRLVYGDREKISGPPRVNFTRVAKAWSGVMSSKLSEDLTPEDVALMMVAFKLCRLAETAHHRDSKVDVIGYMLTYERLLEEK